MADLLRTSFLGTAVRRSPASLLAGLAGLVGFGLGAAVMAPRGPDPATARACSRVATTLLETRDAVELDRSRYLVRELGCDMRAALAETEAAANLAPGLPRAGAAQAGYGAPTAGAFLLNALMVTVVFASSTLLTLRTFTWLARDERRGT